MKNLTQELENAAILKDLVKTIRGNNGLDKTYSEIIVLLANKVLESLEEDPILEVKVPNDVISAIRKELRQELKKSCV